MAVNLHHVLAKFGIQAPELMVSDLVLSSRDVDLHKVFVAVPGHNVDGRDFIPQAVSLGARVIIAHTDERVRHGETDMREHSLIVHFYKLVEQLSLLACEFYDYPANHLDIVAVTGTNGKTTTAQLSAQLSQLCGQTAGTIGTVGAGLLGQLSDVINTTPDAVSMQRLLAEMRSAGAGMVSLEASSHALVQHRITALKTDVAIFTNLTRDHLDYHGTMAEYAAAKRMLLRQPGLKYAVLNQQDPQSARWLAECPESVEPVWFGLEECLFPGQRFCVAKQVTFHSGGSQIQLHSSWGDASFNSPLIGHFNVLNLLAAITAQLCLGKPFTQLMQVAERVQAVAGRMELFSAPGKASVIVDYAHTPDALEQALTAARRHCSGKLWCVFGCGGDRDKGKRPQMGEIAERFADGVMLTNDNSRSEGPQTIVQDILAGCQQPEAVMVELDRATAIQQCLLACNEQDVILVAGKGHEDYQIIGNTRLNYNEREIIAGLLVRETA